MSGRGRHYRVTAEGLPLSLKTIMNGRARYQVGRAELAMDDGGWLVVNEGQSYTIEIEAPVPVETFIVWFPAGWAADVWRGATLGSVALLAGPPAESPVGFHERYTPNEAAVAPVAGELRRALATGRASDEAWLEEKLRELLAAMLNVQHDLRRTVTRLPALRAATREELWRRVSRARDFLHAYCDTPVTLTDAARAAAMSPYHFLRSFKAAFGLTPHDWLTACRMERARFLLARTELPVTSVCLMVGYEGLGTFSSWFRQRTGLSPRAWRRRHGVRAAIRNFQEVFPPTNLITSAPTA